MNFKQILLGFFAVGIMNITQAQVTKAPAYPLVTHSPYFSIWSTTDQLSASTTSHWTGTNQSMMGLIKVDGKIYHFMGKEPVRFKTILPTSEEALYTIKYTETKPEGNWTLAQYNDSAWKTGRSPIGNFEGMDNTLWKSHDIWIRRAFTLTSVEDIDQLLLKLTHDDGAEVMLNGKKLYSKVGPAGYLMLPVDKNNLKLGLNILSMHVENTGGGARADAGFLTNEKLLSNDTLLEAKQNSLLFDATQTRYNFTCGKVNLDLTFTSPLLMSDLNLLSRPVTYIDYKVQSNDGQLHNVQVYFSASTDIAVNNSSQQVTAKKYTASGLSILKAGTVEQPVLKKKGDDLRIDWGYLYVGAKNSLGASQFITYEKDAVNAFKNNDLVTKVTTGNKLSLNTVIPFKNVGATAQSKFIEIAYDEVYAIQYFKQNLRPWWNSSGSSSIEQQLSLATSTFPVVIQKCVAFDKELYANAQKSGGDEYAKLCVMAYRQSIAAHQLVKSPKGEILWLSKENFSNGSINTVDVTYPSAPLYLLYNPNLLKGMLNGIFEYSESSRWTKNFPAHDLGKYPIANGQLYGEDMPVEEAGNMIILADAITRVEKSPVYARLHWKTLTTWANYLLEAGLDPANQLCTDDFAGHLARNANLSVKAIVAIGCYADLAKQMGYEKISEKYRNEALQMAQKWTKLANAGDHYSLAFEKPNTWSQKYNLVWDKVLELNIFPQEVYNTENAYYLTKQNRYGLPLDSRRNYTKSDWITWTATMSSSMNNFKALIAPVYRFAIETPSRVPLSDWHETESGKMSGFQARSVVGGYYIKLLSDRLKNTKQNQ